VYSRNRIKKRRARTESRAGIAFGNFVSPVNGREQIGDRLLKCRSVPHRSRSVKKAPTKRNNNGNNKRFKGTARRVQLSPRRRCLARNCRRAFDVRLWTSVAKGQVDDIFSGRLNAYYTRTVHRTIILFNDNRIPEAFSAVSPTTRYIFNLRAGIS